jgi:hypothetical protein
MLLCRLNQKQKEATTPLHQLSRDVDGGEEGDKPSIVDLLLFHPCAQPITGAEAWELGETVQRVGAMSAGAGVGGSGVVRMGRGRKVSAKVGGVSEGGQSIEEKDNDEEKGKGKGRGREWKGKGKPVRKAQKAKKRNQTRGKRKTQGARGNRTYAAYSDLTHLVVGSEHQHWGLEMSMIL